MKKILNLFIKIKGKILNNKIYKFLFEDFLVLKLIISFILSLIFFSISDEHNIDWLWNLGLILLAYTLLLFLIASVYAWILNPIRRWRIDKKEK